MDAEIAQWFLDAMMKSVRKDDVLNTQHDIQIIDGSLEAGTIEVEFNGMKLLVSVKPID